MPTPTEFGVGVLDLSKAERNANGAMIIERITTKQKLTIAYAYISGNNLATVLNALEPVYYNVTYTNPVTNSLKTASFYCGDRNVGMIDFIGGVPRYKDLTFNLIER